MSKIEVQVDEIFLLKTLNFAMDITNFFTQTKVRFFSKHSLNFFLIVLFQKGKEQQKNLFLAGRSIWRSSWRCSIIVNKREKKELEVIFLSSVSMSLLSI